MKKASISCLIASITLIFFSCKSDKKDILLAMNNVKMPNYEELKSDIKSNDTLKILIIGNSITSHGIASEIGWNYKSGMAASNSNKDFVHLLFYNFSKKYPEKSIILRYANYSEFERQPSKINFEDEKIQELYQFMPNYLIYQLGDNTVKSTEDKFSRASVRFIDGFSKSKKFIVSPFFMNFNNYKCSKSISIDSKSTFIDISYISKDKKYSAIQDSSSFKREWKVEGIGAHPGNLGMYKISDEIFKTIIKEDHKLASN